MTKRFIFIGFLIILQAGCATKPGDIDLFQEQGEHAESLFAEGKYAQAADLFIKLAKQASPPHRDIFLLRSAAALAHIDRIPEAQRILNSPSLTTATSEYLSWMIKLSLAHIAIAQRQPEGVLRIPPSPNIPTMPQPYLAEIRLLRADAFDMLGNRLETAHERVLREQFLSNNEAKLANQQAAWSALSNLNERVLQQLRLARPPDTLSGWMHLVQIAKTYQLRPQQLKQQLVNWRQTHPDHPVLDALLEGLQARRQEDVSRPEHIALLLPLSGQFAKAAEALRDGFLAAYYTHSDRMNQNIRIYDVGNDPNHIHEVYGRAVEEGAQFIVGPLKKEAINLIANSDPLPVPTLALNYTQDIKQIPTNLYQFGLSPEDEAQQVAEHTWLDGHVNAAALIPSGPWGMRVFNAFKERWEQFGGHIVEYQAYNPAEQDFTIPIRMLLNMDDSRRRHRGITTLLKRKVKYTPRRRQDIDFIFLAAYPRQARQLRAQLKFFHADKLPVYATSHVFTGNLDQEMDRDMDGLVFGDMPWVLMENSPYTGIRASVERFISNAGNSLQRLYALGIDAYNIIAALNPLRRYPYERYDGETGSLSLDTKNRVQRQLTWVKFRSGRPTLLNQNTQ